MFALIEKPQAEQADRFVKLSADGATLAADATGHAIVRDTLTNLEWRVAYVADERLDFEDAREACAALRDGGHDDWRLPTRFELESILDLSRYNPAINPSLFPGTKPNDHWSSSPDASDPSGVAWVVNFSDGYVLLYRPGFLAWVRAVRSAAPARQSSSI